jgi:hypothetical protein
VRRVEGKIGRSRVAVKNSNGAQHHRPRTSGDGGRGEPGHWARLGAGAVFCREGRGLDDIKLARRRPGLGYGIFADGRKYVFLQNEPNFP